MFKNVYQISHTKIVVSMRSLNVNTTLKICSRYTDFPGERRAQGFGGETRGKETTGETQAQIGG
jgi:hypothetical protein